MAGKAQDLLDAHSKLWKKKWECACGLFVVLVREGRFLGRRVDPVLVRKDQAFRPYSAGCVLIMERCVKRGECRDERIGGGGSLGNQRVLLSLLGKKLT